MSKNTVPKWLQILKNKYVITFLIFLVVIFILADNNVFLIMRLQREVNRLHKEETSIKDEIVADSIEANRLQNDLDEIERYGREHYFMKRADEDIYVVATPADKD